MKKTKIKLGLLIESYFIPNWVYKMVEEINASFYAEIVLVISYTDIKKENKTGLLFFIYSTFDRLLFKCNPDALEFHDIRVINSDNKIDFMSLKKDLNYELDIEDITKIKSYEIDVLFSISDAIIKNRFEGLSRFGIWKYTFNDIRTKFGGPDGFWEVLDKMDQTSITLQMLENGKIDEQTLLQSYSLTDDLSLNRNLNNCLWKASSFLPMKLKELYETNESDFFKLIDKSNSHPIFYSNKLFKNPSLIHMCNRLIAWWVDRVVNNINKLFYFEQWILLYKINTTLSEASFFCEFKKILPPKDRFWADPFIVFRDNKYYIFFEELKFSEDKGFISVIVMDEFGEYSKPKKIIEENYHLSYPFIIEVDGVYYMVPESNQNHTVDLYKCTSFPYEWKFEKTLIKNIDAVDATIIFKDNKYWMFVNVKQKAGASNDDELFIYYADNIFSDYWISHPKNPVLSDVKKARPAGKLFYHKGDLYRPSQNCSKRYGYGMKINRVIWLDEENYEEKVVDSIYPNWEKNLLATHTFNKEGNLTIIDAQIKRKKFFITHAIRSILYESM